MRIRVGESRTSVCLSVRLKLLLKSRSCMKERTLFTLPSCVYYGWHQAKESQGSKGGLGAKMSLFLTLTWNNILRTNNLLLLTCTGEGGKKWHCMPRSVHLVTEKSSSQTLANISDGGQLIRKYFHFFTYLFLIWEWPISSGKIQILR